MMRIAFHGQNYPKSERSKSRVITRGRGELDRGFTEEKKVEIEKRSIESRLFNYLVHHALDINRMMIESGILEFEECIMHPAKELSEETRSLTGLEKTDWYILEKAFTHTNRIKYSDSCLQDLINIYKIGEITSTHLLELKKINSLLASMLDINNRISIIEDEMSKKTFRIGEMFAPDESLVLEEGAAFLKRKAAELRRLELAAMILLTDATNGSDSAGKD